MKTNPFLLLTTVLLCSGASLTANDNLCGGADDDQLCGGADDDQVFGAPSLCGGADDDQFRPPVPQGLVSDPLGVVAPPAKPPVLKGLTTDPLGLPPPPKPFAPAIAPDPMAMWAALTGPVVPFQICGGNGNDSLWGGGGTDEIDAGDPDF